MTAMATLELPERLRPVLDAVVAVSDGYEGVYLVGGSVRDILLGEPSFDVDVVVEGDAIALAQALAEQLDGRVRAHRQFGTAVVLYGDDERVDVVTARSETYHAPAVLPSVEPGSIDDDLHRRDFTINAMAVSLKGENLGRLVDPFGGREDLEAGRIRILHDRSFVDDPTRILRAIRYEDRYGFRMDDETVRLARECIATGHVGDLSGARLRDELVALLEEGDVSHAIPRLAELGAEKEVHPHVVADEEAVGLFDRLRELNQRYELGVPAWRLGLEALARKLPPAEIAPWLEGLKIRRPDGDQIAAAIVEGAEDRGRSRRNGGRRRRRGRAPRSGRSALRPGVDGLAPAARVLRAAARGPARDLRRGSRRAGPRRVAPRRADPRRAPAPEAERRAGRPRGGARSGTGADRLSVPLLRWEVGGPYDVVFSTRVGGVSEGPFESLNLGRRTGDEVERVDENRRRLCAEVDADEQALTLGFQTHSTVVNRAEAGSRGVPGDAIWTDEPGVPMLALGADCVLMAMARTNGAEPALAVIHAGWRGLIDGVVDTTAETIGPGFAAVVGPSIGPCCYEVGEEVASRFRDRFGDGIVSEGKLDLWTAAERAARDAGATEVERVDLCTRCRSDLFFSERRTGRPRGTQGVLGVVR